MRPADHLIIGGGPAGAAAAIMLARAGARALLLERHAHIADALCGGFVSWRTCSTLQKLGIAPHMLSGWPIDRVRIFAENRSVEVRLPAPSMGISRKCLDQALLLMAERSGARIERGVNVVRAEPGRVETADGAILHCQRLYLATGKYDCRGLARQSPRLADPFIGLRVRIPASASLQLLVGSAVELHFFEGGYAGLLLQEDGSGNLCLAVRKSRLGASGALPRRLLAALSADSPVLTQRLAEVSSGTPIDAIGPIPYGWRARTGVPGLFRLGDQAAVIPSFAGEGIGIALASGILASQFQRSDAGEDAVRFQKALARKTSRPVRISSVLFPLAENMRIRGIIPVIAAHVPALARLIAYMMRIDP